MEFKEGWDIIQNGILKLTETLITDRKDEFPISDYVNIYTTVYTMCTQKRPHCYAQQLYDKYRDSLEEYIVCTVLPALAKVHDEIMLKEFVKQWENHMIIVRFMSSMFNYLDVYIVRKMSLASLTAVGIMCFKDKIYHVIQNVKNVVIELIDREREGEQIDHVLLRNILNIFVEIGMGGMDFYSNYFEAPMLEDTGTYYSRRAALWILEHSCPDYMLKAEECLRREKERVGHYLHSSTEQKLLEKVKKEILSRYQTQLLENEYSGFHALFMGEKKDDLSRMYRLFCGIPKGLEPVANIFKQHVTCQGITLFKKVEDAVSNNNAERGHIGHEFVEKIIELHENCVDYLVDVFQKSNIFHKALREAFGVICNKSVEETTTAELLATFCDNVLKKGGMVKISDDQIESILQKALILLQYVSDRDLFCEFYRERLASRLLFHRSADDSNERTILSKIKDQVGLRFTSKMEVMLNDFTVARETQADFRKYLDGVSNMHRPGIELTVTVLNNGCWPTYKSSELNLPSEILKCIGVYKGFYSSKYQHRILKWIYCLGNCQIIGKFNSKSIEITASTNQAVMLLLFNNSERLSYEDIKSQLNLPDDDVLRLLHSILRGKLKIIVQQPISRTIEKTDHFEFNPSFTCKSTRIKIPLPQIDEKKKITEVVDTDRRYAIDAAIVRIMKSRKVLTSPELSIECIQQLQALFKPKFKTIMMRIEDLILREFLERDTENSNIIRYLA